MSLLDESLTKGMLKSFKLLEINDRGVFTKLSFLGREYSLGNGYSLSKSKRATNPVVSKQIHSNEKLCKRCNTVKPVSEFYVDKASKDGLQKWCKQCFSEYRKNEGKRKYVHHNDPAKKDKKQFLGKRLAVIQNNGIYENLLKEIVSFLSDGEKHLRSEIKSIIQKYYPMGREGGLNSKTNSYLKYLKEEHKAILKDEIIPDRGHKKRYWIENKIIREKACKTNRIFFSDGRFPIKPNADGDRKFIKDRFDGGDD